ncbi:MAG TPA: M20/M25/M40 family metallo-hydrolase [Ideonella sp.]|nr:M20/M25/M40 family metallo-hydrolase [Ideonella sp.]
MSKNFRHSTLVAALCAAALLASTGASAAPRSWISVGEAAYQVLLKAKAPVANVEAVTMTVTVPAAAAGKATGKAASLAERSSKVYLLQIDESALPALSRSVHEELHRCGGYVAHASQADGRKSLQRLQGLTTAAAQARTAAAAPSYAIDNPETVNALLPLVQESHVLSTIQKLSDYQNRYYTTTHGVAASDDLARTWRQMAAGRADVKVQQVTHSWAQKSVVLTIKGTVAPKEIVVIGGHLDSTSGFFVRENTRAPGADDDASGIASLQEVMRVLLTSGYKPKRTIQFMAYAAEEVGLRGSAAIAADYASKGRKVVGALQLDMTNYQGSDSDITLITDYTNAAQNDFLGNLASTYLPTLSVVRGECGYACSDHASWTSNGYVSSFPFEAPLGEDNPFIHTKNDTLAQSGNMASHAVKFTRLALAYAVELGSDAPAAKR